MNSLTQNPATVRTRDGVDLVLRHWPAVGSVRGTLVIVHGLGEHIGRYEHVAGHLVARGWAVSGYDQRGHGASQGKRGALRTADDLIDDLTRVIAAVRVASPVRPFVLLGHSMGGLVAAQFVAEARGAVDALVLSSPVLEAGLTLAQRVQLALGHALAPDLAMSNQIDAKMISHDPAVVRAYVNDPLVHDRVTARLARALVNGGKTVLARAGRWPVPTLLLWAGEDKLVSPRGSAAFAAAAPAAALRAKCFAGLYHEIFNERDATPVFAALDEWLDPRRAG